MDFVDIFYYNRGLNDQFGVPELIHEIGKLLLLILLLKFSSTIAFYSLAVARPPVQRPASSVQRPARHNTNGQGRTNDE